MLSKILFLLGCADYISSTLATSCSNQSFVFTSNSRRGISDFLFIAQSTVEIKLKYQCFSQEVPPAEFYWLKQGENTTTGRYLWYARRKYPFRYISQKDSGKDISLSYKTFDYGFEVTTTISNISSSYDNSVFQLKNYDTVLVQRQIDVYCCSSRYIPKHLAVSSSWSGDSLNCLSMATVICKSKSMFVVGSNNYYRTNTTINCETNRLWTNSGVECVDSCPYPPYPHLYVGTYPRKSQRYKVETKLSMLCRNGRMHSSASPTHFIEKTEITCDSSGAWSDDGVSCWSGQIVDFTNSRINLLSGQPTIFTCTAKQPLDASLEVKEVNIRKDGKVWENITLTPKHNGLTALCKAIDSFDIEVNVKKTYLNVQYMPELTGKVLSRYEFASESTNYVAVHFRANPPLALNDAVATKNGSLLKNFYLTVNGTDHEAILHFRKVLLTDAGSYTVSLQSHSPVANLLAINFTIVVTPPLYHSVLDSPGNIAAIALGILLFIGIIVAIVGCVKLTKRERGGGTDVKSKKTDLAVVYDPSSDQPKYEDVDDPTYYVSMKKGQYENTKRTKPTQNQYVASMRPKLPPPVAHPKIQEHNMNYRYSTGSMDSFEDCPIYDNQ